jgi:hypothetical protein
MCAMDGARALRRMLMTGGDEGRASRHGTLVRPVTANYIVKRFDRVAA